jgi:hypothetical protein
MWYRSQDERLAAVPFHDPSFWSDSGLWSGAMPAHHLNHAEGGTVLARGNTQQVRANSNAAEVERDSETTREHPDYVGGTMAWPTFKLKKNRLFLSDKQRKHTKSGGASLYFRRYYNLAYDSSKTADELEDLKQEYYKSITQGYMFGGHSKIKFGAAGFRVTRSHKYGNVCRDCAGLLDRAPGLFVRNNRWQFDGGIVRGNVDAVDSTHNYWQHAFGRGSEAALDAFLMKGRPARWSRLPADERAKWVREFDKAAKILKDTLNARHKFPEKWTRLVEEPTIHIQGTCVGTDRKPEDIQRAIRDLRALFNGADPASLRLNNPALRDIVKEAERKYLHNEAYARIDATKQFDTDVIRTEYRNCIIRWSGPGELEWLNFPGHTHRFRYTGQESVKGKPLPLSGKRFGKLTATRYAGAPPKSNVFYNCLITDQFDPDLLDTRNIRDVRLPKSGEDYRVEVYLNTRRGPTGQQQHPPNCPTQWKGDAFVCRQPDNEGGVWTSTEYEEDGRVLVQHRTLRQSRLFITYSLHRPISSEGEGRVILEKMADALRTLFGEDRWLSEMIVFGKMLSAMDVGRQKGDNVSSAMWTIIGKTKKQEAMANFYGNGSSTHPRTSYVYDTYETHMDQLEVDAGCEIGPKMGHPHFHCLLTMNHFGYVHFDYFKMNAFLEIMFRGVETLHNWGKNYFLPGFFYGDNENPYVDVRLYPQDNWQQIIAAYVRKNAIPSIVEVEKSRRLPGSSKQRQGVWGS